MAIGKNHMVRNTKPEPDEFSENAFVQDIQSKKELLQKEIDVNQEAQSTLKKRMQVVKDFLATLAADDPQYSIVHIQIRKDQIELDELIQQEEGLLAQINKLQGK